MVKYNLQHVPMVSSVSGLPFLVQQHSIQCTAWAGLWAVSSGMQSCGCQGAVGAVLSEGFRVCGQSVAKPTAAGAKGDGWSFV